MFAHLLILTRIRNFRFLYAFYFQFVHLQDALSSSSSSSLPQWCVWRSLATCSLMRQAFDRYPALIMKMTAIAWTHLWETPFQWNSGLCLLHIQPESTVMNLQVMKMENPVYLRNHWSQENNITFKLLKWLQNNCLQGLLDTHKYT